MIDSPLAREMLARYRTRDLMREAERDRLIRLATAGRRAEESQVEGIWTRVRRLLGPAGVRASRPSVTIAG